MSRRSFPVVLQATTQRGCVRRGVVGEGSSPATDLTLGNAVFTRFAFTGINTINNDVEF